MKLLNILQQCTARFTCAILLGVLAPNLGWCMTAKPEEAPVASSYSRHTYYGSKEGNIFTTHKIQKTILSPEGIAAVSPIGFTYSQNDRVRVISVAVTQPDGKCIKLKKRQMDTRLIASSQNGFTRDKHLSFLFPELKVGSTVELHFEHYHLGRLDPGQVGLFPHYLPMNERIDSLFEEYTSDAPWIVKDIDTQGYDIKLSEDKKRLTIELKSPKYYHLINELPGSFIRKYPRVAMHTTEDLDVSVAREVKAWNDNLKAPLPKSMADVVDKLKDKPSEEKVIELLRYLRNNYRYLGDWRGVKRGWLPFSLAEIAKQGYGDCKDLSMALIAMLRASGIEAEPCLLQRGNAAHPILLPSVVVPNHAIVRAKVGDKIWWLDPTNHAFLPDYIFPDLHDRWVLILGADNRVRYDRVPREPSDVPELKTESTIYYDQKGNQYSEGITTIKRFQAILTAVQDYYQGIEKSNLAFCAGDTKHCQIQREKIDFLVPAAYTVNTSRYQKGAAQVVSPKNLLVSYTGLDSLAVQLRHYIDNQNERDLWLSTNFIANHSCDYRLVFKECELNQPVKPYHIESPWLDYELKWYNSKEENGCVLEFRRVRKVDWLDHKTIKSPEFQVFLEELEKMTKEMQQVLKVTREKDIEPGKGV